MSREANPHVSVLRCLVVWVAVTLVTLAVGGGMAAPAASLAGREVWSGTFAELLVAIASAALLACAGWVWVVTTSTVVDVIGSPGPVRPSGLTRRLVLVACGAAVAAGMAGPAVAASPDRAGPELAGLPLPDRASASSSVRTEPPRPGSRSVPAPAPARTASQVARKESAAITVHAGDSLWSIARAGLGPRAGVTQVDAAWRALYAANREVVGPDPDVIHPGTALHPTTRKARP